MASYEAVDESCPVYGRAMTDPPVGSDSEFAFALHLAVEIGVTEPLRDYGASGMPVPTYPVMIKDWPVRDAPDLVAELLGQPAAQQETRGRPFRIAAEAQPAEQAERNAACGWWRLH
jgi:hypothetical protein